MIFITSTSTTYMCVNKGPSTPDTSSYSSNITTEVSTSTTGTISKLLLLNCSSSTISPIENRVDSGVDDIIQHVLRTIQDEEIAILYEQFLKDISQKISVEEGFILTMERPKERDLISLS